MGEKKNNNNEGGDKSNKKKGDGENKKEEKKPITVVLKIDMNCECCASKIVKCARSLDGVETVKADIDANKLTVTGNVDPSKIREKLQHKLKKKVDLISPQPKKEDTNKNDNKDSKQDKKPDEKKPKEKEAPVTTAVLKVSFHCQGCFDKINKIVHNTKGVHEHSLAKQKDLVTVKGTMDVKALVETLRERLKRDVEVVPPKKEKDSGGGDNNAGGGGGGKKKKGGGDGGGQEGESGGGKVEGNRLEYVMQPGFEFGYGYPIGYPTGYEYPLQYPVQYHAPQMFSDENPNACTIM